MHVRSLLFQLFYSQAYIRAIPADTGTKNAPNILHQGIYTLYGLLSIYTLYGLLWMTSSVLCCFTKLYIIGRKQKDKQL